MRAFDFSAAPHGSREIFQYLKVCAANMYTNNYKEICDQIKRSGTNSVSVLPIAIGAPLGYIRTLCIEHEVPWINALAVSVATWRPGDSFLPGDASWHPSHELLWRGMVLQVFSYDWSLIAIK